jgi:hypothetical protein
VDVQAVTIDGRDSVRVRRFRTATPRPQPPAAAVRLTTDHIKEASTFLAPRAIEAALIETQSRFPLSSKVLIDLDKAGVADSVIDLMVALSYPKSFAVRPSGPDDRLLPPPLFTEPGYFDASLEYPYYYSPYYFGYAGYFYSPYYFSPFGYSYLRFYPEFGLPIAVIEPGGGGVPGRNNFPQQGKAVNGFGYTRVFPRDRDGTVIDGGATPSARSTATSRGSVSPRGYSAGDGGSSSSSSSSGGSGGSSSSGGSSGGGGGDSGGRTAVPR